MHRLKRFRLLGCVVLLAALAAAWERMAPDRDDSPSNRQLPYVMRELYPESSRILYVEAMTDVLNGNLPEARARFEAALATGERTNEDLLYYYAVTLVKMDADPEEIEKAVAAWRFNFPFSSRPHPRSPEAAAAGPESIAD
jgi:hypothetical protein